MKGLPGIAIAAVLGVLGMALNWFYLENKSKQLDTVTFLGIRDQVEVQSGDTFVENHFVEVPIPRKHAGDLEDFTYLWADRETLVGVKATKDFQGGELVFKEDYRTPQLKLELKPNERLIPITVGERSPLLEPGDDVSFWFPASAKSVSIGRSGGQTSGDVLGPFRVGAIGNQVGSREVMQAYRMPLTQGNQLGIIVRMEGSEFEPSAKALLARIAEHDSRSIKVISHPQQK